jgi:sugar phosphate isomerase/epimerase
VIGPQGRPKSGQHVHLGEVELPLRQKMQGLLDAGYTGLFDLEVVPAEFSAGDDEAGLGRSRSAACTLLEELGI